MVVLECSSLAKSIRRKKLKSSTGSFYVSNSKGHRMFLNGGEGTKVMAHAMVIAEFEEVKDGNK